MIGAERAVVATRSRPFEFACQLAFRRFLRNAGSGEIDLYFEQPLIAALWRWFAKLLGLQDSQSASLKSPVAIFRK